MIEKIKKYWGEIPLIYYIGLIVEPRLKFDALDEWLQVICVTPQIPGCPVDHRQLAEYLCLIS